MPVHYHVGPAGYGSVDHGVETLQSIIRIGDVPEIITCLVEVIRPDGGSEDLHAPFFGNMLYGGLIIESGPQIVPSVTDSAHTYFLSVGVIDRGAFHVEGGEGALFRRRGGLVGFVR